MSEDRWRRLGQSQTLSLGTEVIAELRVFPSRVGGFRGAMLFDGFTIWSQDYMTEVGAKAGAEAFAREMLTEALAILGPERGQ